MQHFLPVRKAFLVAALVFVFDFVLGTAVALQLNLSDPAIGGSARDNWFTAGTPLSAPGVFMILYVIFLMLAMRRRLIGIAGVIGVSLMTLISGLSLIGDAYTGLLQRLIEHHLTIMTAFTLVVFLITVLTIVILGIITLVQQRRAHTRIAIP